MRIELSIGRLVADGVGDGNAEEFVAALTAELRAVLAREFGGGQRGGVRAIRVPRLRAALTLPQAAGTAPAARPMSAGRAIGAALGGAVVGDQVFSGGTSR
jgi:hypothetical protein